MRVYLDDRRVPPDASWVLAATPEEVIRLLEGGEVSHLSLDHDLGLLDEDGRDTATGYDVLLYIEKGVVLGTLTFEVPEIDVHSGNIGAHERMVRARNSIYERIGRPIPRP
jgi:hypothetical protein